MKKFKPVIMIIPEDTDDLFVDVEYLQKYREEGPLNKYFYEGLALGFGENVFVFDVNSCKYTMNKKSAWARIYYTIGVISGAFYQLAKSIHVTNKHFAEFDKWLKKIKKEKEEEK